MHLAFLGAADSWYLNDLRRAAAGQHEITPVSFRDLSSTIAEGHVSVCVGNIDLSQFDAVLIRAMPPGSLEQIVFRMDAIAQLQAAGIPAINSPRAIEVAVDKYLAAARMSAAGLLVPATITCQTPEAAMAAFDKLGGDVVVKPVFGSEGRGIARLSDEALAERAFRMLAQLGGVLYVQKFIPHHGSDIRVLVIGESLLAIRRRNDRDWRTNVSRGAVAEPIELSKEMAEVARRASAAVGAEIAGVDLLPGLDGRLYAIEVNAVPGWTALAKALATDVTELVLRYVLGRVARHRG